MNRYAWLLAFPYVVQVSSYTVYTRSHDIVVGETEHVEYLIGPIMTRDKELAEDFAEAMNSAHERRTSQASGTIPFAVSTQREITYTTNLSKSQCLDLQKDKDALERMRK